MPTARLIQFLASPLARHPRLLARKVAQRLGWAPRFAFRAPPAAWRMQACPELASGLRRWVADVAPVADPHPDARLFGQDFDPATLHDLCRRGPATRADLLGDVKLIWEFGRSPGLVLDALRAPPARQPAAAARGADFLRAWLASNADPAGPAWNNAMEVALRAVAWLCADAALDGVLQRAVGPDLWRNTMWHHRCAIAAGLEARLVSSNHYLANLLGLYFLKRHAGDTAGAPSTARELEAAFVAQARADGGAYEASLPYHAFITEMGLFYTLLAGPQSGPTWRGHLKRMVQIVADFSMPGQDVFPIGDDDSGRVIPLDDAAPHLGRAGVLLALARTALGASFARSGNALCPDSGWWVARSPACTALLEFGGVGFHGLGGHAHNDDLSVCAWWEGRPVFTDPGSYLYTPDPAARNLFRSTRAHNVLSVDEREQRPLPEGPRGLFSLPGDDAARPVQKREPLSITCSAPLGGGIWQRTVQVRADGLTVRDEVSGPVSGVVRARFLLHPDWQAAQVATGLRLQHRDGTCLTFRSEPALKLRLEPGWISPRYGSKLPAMYVLGEASGPWPAAVTWHLSA